LWSVFSATGRLTRAAAPAVALLFDTAVSRLLSFDGTTLEDRLLIEVIKPVENTPFDNRAELDCLFLS
jgi:hypothetical protein